MVTDIVVTKIYYIIVTKMEKRKIGKGVISE